MAPTQQKARGFGFSRHRLWEGAIAQLGERVVRNDEVRGSIPLSSTNGFSRNCDFLQRIGPFHRPTGCIFALLPCLPESSRTDLMSGPLFGRRAPRGNRAGFAAVRLRRREARASAVAGRGRAEGAPARCAAQPATSFRFPIPGKACMLSPAERQQREQRLPARGRHGGAGPCAGKRASGGTPSRPARGTGARGRSFVANRPWIGTAVPARGEV